MMNDMNDMKWYQVLGVKKTESLLLIRQKYKQLALKFHPDKNNGDDTQFKLILNAYESRLTQPEIIIDSRDYTLDETDESNEIFNFLFNTRNLNDKITIDTLQKLVERYQMTPFNKNKQSYINILFLRISREKLNEKLEAWHMSNDGTKDELINRFLFGKIKKQFLEKSL